MAVPSRMSTAHKQTPYFCCYRNTRVSTQEGLRALQRHWTAQQWSTSLWRKPRSSRLESSCFTWQGFVPLIWINSPPGGACIQQHRPLTTSSGRCGRAGGSRVLPLPPGHPPAPKGHVFSPDSASVWHLLLCLGRSGRGKSELCKQFPSYRWCFQYPVSSGDVVRLAQWNTPCLSGRKALMCALCIPQSLQEL